MNWPKDFINKIICGDCLEIMQKMPANCIDMCLTSPPYWGLRDYGIEQVFGGDADCQHEWGNKIVRRSYRHVGKSPNVSNQKKDVMHGQENKGQFCRKCGAWKGQIGLEPSPEMYIEHLIRIFIEVKRVLKKSGSLWLNIGDTYGGSCQGGGDTGLSKERYRKELLTYINKPQRKLMPKCLLMIPERLIWALIQNGWILRNKIPWVKPNCMPASVKDRFSNKWEYIFYLAKSKKNYFDLNAALEPYTKPLNRWGGNRLIAKGVSTWSEETGQKIYRHRNMRPNPKGKNPGDVWVIGTQPCPIKGVHFATFPEELCRKAIIPGCPENGIMLDPFCGVGTACYIARKLRRKYIGIDINRNYVKKAIFKRLAQGALFS